MYLKSFASILRFRIANSVSGFNGSLAGGYLRITMEKVRAELFRRYRGTSWPKHGTYRINPPLGEDLVKGPELGNRGPHGPSKTPEIGIHIFCVSLGPGMLDDRACRSAGPGWLRGRERRPGYILNYNLLIEQRFIKSEC
jgi:hypothetical protein